MWKNGELDIIEGIDVRTYKQRCQLVETYGLTLGRVNSLHGRLDDFIRHNRKGVSTIYLPLQLSMPAWNQAQPKIREKHRREGAGNDI